MLFPTFTFAAFFAVVVPLSWALRGRPVAWKLLILVASYAFYGFGTGGFSVCLRR